MSRQDRPHSGYAWRWEHIVPALCLLAAPVLASARPVLEFAGSLAEGSPLVRPNSVHLSSDATILCVTDQGSGTLDLFDEQGFHRFRTDAVSEIHFPEDGSVDREGRFVYIELGGRGSHTICRLNFFGEPDGYEPVPVDEGWRPVHLTITRDGNYVTTSGNGVLAKHDAVSGELLWAVSLFDGEFERADQTSRPAEGPDGSLYIALTGARQIAVVSAEGVLQGQFGTPGAKAGELAFPVGVAVLGDGQVLVLDRMRHSILVYSKDHRLLGESGRFGQGPGELYHPAAIAASTDGHVYIAQNFEGRVQRFRLRDSEVTRKDSGS